MSFKIVFLGICFSWFSLAAVAGSGHDHASDHGHSHSHLPVDSVAAKANATKILAALVKRNVVDKSWAAVKATSVEQKEIKGNPEWVVIFDNAGLADKSKRKLYLFLTLGGDYIAANYSGK
ncbi:MAG: DUF6488 family protein [Gammaproteobacteria bacterium]|nr:DUF6488 family protein [Gammaproteobacteria bacterium]